MGFKPWAAGWQAQMDPLNTCGPLYLTSRSNKELNKNNKVEVSTSSLLVLFVFSLCISQ